MCIWIQPIDQLMIFFLFPDHRMSLSKFKLSSLLPSLFLLHAFLFEMSIVCAVCPLDFEQPSEVIKDCRNVAAPSPSCCSSLNTYIAGIQKQMLITNKQAIICATMFGSMLRKGGVMTNVYELCDVDLKDFSIQGNNAYCIVNLIFLHHQCFYLI